MSELSQRLLEVAGRIPWVSNAYLGGWLVEAAAELDRLEQRVAELEKMEQRAKHFRDKIGYPEVVQIAAKEILDGK